MIPPLGRVKLGKTSAEKNANANVGWVGLGVTTGRGSKTSGRCHKIRGDRCGGDNCIFIIVIPAVLKMSPRQLEGENGWSR